MSIQAKEIAAIILAAGKGTRMKSKLAKVLHKIDGKPMLMYPVEVARKIGAEPIIAVVGHQSNRIKEELRGTDIIFADQKEQMGTAHAVLQARDFLTRFRGTILILCGDVPLLRQESVESLIRYHLNQESTVTVMTAMLEDPKGYGRVIKNSKGEVLRVVEERDATVEEKKIKEINTGIYCIEGDFLFDAISRIGKENAQGEYYLTDIFEIAYSKGMRMRSFIIADPMESMGINTREELLKANTILTQRKPAGSAI